MKPKIAILADMRNWAWARKSEQLVQHLGDQFSLQVAHLYDKDPDPLPQGCDLYHTYEVFQVHHLAPSLPYVTGMTAHVWDGHVVKHGQEAMRRVCDRARAFHANSKLLEREMAGRLRRPILYTPNGVDENFFQRKRARVPGGRLIVGWVGKPNPRKGADIVKQACAAAGVDLRTIERTHRNALGPERMRDFYQDLHVLAVQSDMDGTPNPALEAAACGVAIVSNRIGNMPEFIRDGENGRFVERSVESLAAALREMTINDALRMGHEARATIEAGWTWRHLAPNYARMWLGALEAA